MGRSPLAALTFVLLILGSFRLGFADEPHEPAPSRGYKIQWVRLLGGSGSEQAREVICLADGSVLVGGQTSSKDLPVTPGVVQPKYGGEPAGTGHPGTHGGDCFVVRLAGDGKVLACTYFGGSKQERNTYGFALDSQGDLVICSATRSPDLATTPGCFQAKYGGPPADMFAAKLSPDLKNVRWCTYVGGRQDDWPRGGITIDRQDCVYIVGGTSSDDFPVTSGAYQARRRGDRDAALVKLAPDGSKVVYATLLGGSHWDGLMGVRVDAKGFAYVAGHTRSEDFPVTAGAAQPKLGGNSDAVLAKFSPDGGKLVYATYLGGRENEFAEHPPLLAPDGSLILAGSVSSEDFPTTPGAFQRKKKSPHSGFVARLSADGRRFVFATVLGGSGGEFWLQPQLDARGNIYVVGQTSSRDLPVTPSALQRAFGGGGSDGALMVLSGDGSKLLYGTYLGGSGNEMIRTIALGPRGEIYLAGNTNSRDFPSAHAKPRGQDAFVVRLRPEIPPPPPAGGPQPER